MPDASNSSPAVLVERIDAVLPQTQCKQCGFDGCLPYAQALAAGSVEIDRCPPGGDPVVSRLARLLGRAVRVLDASRGPHLARRVAAIDADACIGCTLCIQACPVDAISGAPKLMHTVISFECTGCALCIPPCPVDCIALEAAPWTLLDAASGERARAANTARDRFHSRRARLERDARGQPPRTADRAAVELPSAQPAADCAAERKRAIVEAALARARARVASLARSG